MLNVYSVRVQKPYDILEYFKSDLDLIMVHRGDSMPAKIADLLINSGWLGGQFCRWVDGGDGQPTIDMADGRYCGLFPFGSREVVDKHTAIEYTPTEYGVTTFNFGGNFVYTRIYERYGYLARHSLGPMIPLVYKANQSLYVSENGKITNEDESNFVIFPVHTFPNGEPILVPFIFFGIVAVVPYSTTNQYMGVQTNFGI